MLRAFIQICLARQRTRKSLILLGRYLAIAFISMAAAATQAQNREANPRLIRLNGPISSDMQARLKLSLAHFNNKDPFPAGLIVLLDSPGGDGENAMQIGRLLRDSHAHVFVTRRCESACVFILMGGVVRAATAGSVGVHSGRLTMMTREGKVVEEIDASKNLGTSFQLTTFNTSVREYLREMGIAHGILDVMLAQPPDRLYYLTTTELDRYQVNAISTPYLEERLSTLIRDASVPVMTREVFTRRTLSVPRRCGATQDSDLFFTQCYRQTLLAKPHQ